MKTIANYEARTHWSEMLQDAKRGQGCVILHKGKPIAEFVPHQSENRQTRSKRAAEKLLQLMSARALAEVDIKSLVDEGRD